MTVAPATTPVEQPAQPTPPKAAPVSVDLAAPISDFDAAWRIAVALSQSNLMPEALRGKTSDVFVTMMWGRDLGFSPMQAVQAIYVVNGRPMLGYQGWLAVTRRAGHKVRVIEHDDQHCIVEIIRKDDPDVPVRQEFTIEDATRAGLAAKDIWKKYPRNMLLGRAVANACRIACPEVALGIGTEDEGDGPAAHSVSLADAAAAREAAIEDAKSNTATPVVDPDADIEDAVIVDDDAADDDAKDVANAAAVAALAAEHSTTGTAPTPPAAKEPEQVADAEPVDPDVADEPDPRDEDPGDDEVPDDKDLPDELFPSTP